ncbi:MAG: hypothetical protein ACFB03_15205 [Paracoccaceae bacterium]
MFTSRTWTILDSLTVGALLVLSMRILIPANEPGVAFVHGGSERTEAIAPLLVHPPREATDWVMARLPARLDGAIRCIGLAEAEVRYTCKDPSGRACVRARAERTVLTNHLWPERQGRDFIVAANAGIDRYASAYTALAERRSNRSDASSRLIRARDGAICRQYLKFTGTRPHGAEDRQPSRTVQEGPRRGDARPVERG